MVNPDDNQTFMLERSSFVNLWGGGSKYNVKRRMKSLTIIDYNLKTGTPQLQLSDPVI